MHSIWFYLLKFQIQNKVNIIAISWNYETQNIYLKKFLNKIFDCMRRLIHDYIAPNYFYFEEA